MNLNEQKKRMKDLVETYVSNREEYQKSTYNETQTRTDFINRFLEIFGWDISNKTRQLHFFRDVIQEESIDIDEENSSKKKPDYTLRLNAKRVLFVEAKKASYNLLSSKKASFQVRRYGWNANLPISVLSNFEHLVIYDTRFRPKPDDSEKIARYRIYSYKEYVNKFEEIYDLLSKQRLSSGSLLNLFPVDKPQKGMEKFDQFFLSQIERWRIALAQNILKENADMLSDQINYLIQQTINRIIFLRICEDRETEKYEKLKNVKNYEELKKVFVEADKKYDSRLFNFIDDKLSLEISIDESVLINIFKNLYYPLSPYAFSIVEPSILGEIYEMFLSKETVIDAGTIKILEKPEIVQQQGAITTPNYVVEQIVSDSLNSKKGIDTIKILRNIKVADIACGSGIFLLSTFDNLLQKRLEYYLKDGPTKHKTSVQKVSSGEWRLTLEERRNILEKNIFGVDVDYQAVQVAKFSLLVKLLEDVSREDINHYIQKYKRPVLPKLDSNILWGNSLIDNSYYDYSDNAEKDDKQLVDIIPFDFESTFRGIFKSGGFDVIIGNPPYIRIQNMVKYSPKEVGFYQSKSSNYLTAKSNNYDKYFLFIERALHLLNPKGILGYIVPHKFFITKAGGSLRKVILKNSSIKSLIHFGTCQVFGSKVSTYTSILILDKEKKYNKIKFQYIRNLNGWIYSENRPFEMIKSDKLSDESWVFVPKEISKIFESMDNDKELVSLDSIADIFVGLQTSYDKVYIIKPLKETKQLVFFEDKNSIKRKIEKKLLKKCLYDVSLEPFGTPEHNSYIIFPYEVTAGKASLLSEKEFKRDYPLGYSYLLNFKKELAKRSIQNKTSWYQFGRSQSLAKFDGTEKLVWPVLSLEPRYNLDTEDIAITGGGNGPYYALRPKSKDTPILYIQGILSHPIIEAYVRSRASVFRGGYGSHGKQFIAKIPFPKYSNKFKQISELTKKITDIRLVIRTAKMEKQRTLAVRQYIILTHKLYSMINKIYGFSHEDLKAVSQYQNLERKIKYEN